MLLPLIRQVDNAPFPTEFQLPEDIRTTFKDGKSDFLDVTVLLKHFLAVGTGDRGNYVDAAEIKPPRLK
jgi:hypothetical protein